MFYRVILVLMRNLIGHIGIKDLSIFCIIGCKPFERTKEAEIFVDIELKTSFSKVIAEDHISHTICYEKVAKICHEIAVQGQFISIEALAHAILEGIYAVSRAEEKPILSLSIMVKKPKALENAHYCYVKLSKEI
jgi:FolB domain-containing protein